MRIVLFIFIIFFSNCGTRKRVLQKTNSDISQIQNLDIVKTDDITLQTNIAVKKTFNSIRYKPVDNTKPIIIDNVKYTNTIVEIDLIQESDSTKTLQRKQLEIIDRSTTNIDVKKSKKTTNVDRDNSFDFWDWFWLLLALAALFGIYNRLKR